MSFFNFKKYMIPTIVLSTASILVRSKKIKVILAGLQFGYLAYCMLNSKNKNKSKV